MKTSYKLASAALIGALGVGLAVASDSQAAANPWETEGKVEFKGANNTTSRPIYPPGTTDPEISGPKPNPDDKDLKIREVAEPDFDVHDIVAVSGMDSNFPAKTYVAKAVSDGSDVKMPHFVRFQDFRTDGLPNHYSITASLTKQFVNGTTNLTGATVSYKNATLISGTNVATMPDVSVTGASLEQNITLTEDGQAKPVMTNKQADKGFGTFEIMFGTYADAITETHNENVTLFKPAATVVKAGEYKAEITWTISDAR